MSESFSISIGSYFAPGSTNSETRYDSVKQEPVDPAVANTRDAAEPLETEASTDSDSDPIPPAALPMHDVVTSENHISIVDADIKPSGLADYSPPEDPSKSGADCGNSKTNHNVDMGPPILIPESMSNEMPSAVPVANTNGSRRGQRRTREEMKKRIPLDVIIRQLTDPVNGSHKTGVSPKQLDDHMSKMPENERPSKSKNHLQVLLWRDVNQSKIVRTGSGRYTVPDFCTTDSIFYKERKGSNQSSQIREEGSTMKHAIDATTNDADTSEPPEQPIAAPEATEPEVGENHASLVPSRPKRIRMASKVKTYALDTPRKVNENAAPSSQNPKPRVVKRKAKSNISDKRSTKKRATRRAPVSSTGLTRNPRHVCDYCLQQRRQNALGQSEGVLICTDCGARAHSSCLGYTLEHAVSVNSRDWQCVGCKRCSICHKVNITDKGQLLFCVNCDHAFHMSCHSPVVQRRPPRSWMCTGSEVAHEMLRAQESKNRKNHKKLHLSSHSPANSTSSNISALSDLLINSEQMNILQSASNEASNWSIKQVSDFIGQLGYAKESQVFFDQEIDGSSLLLLRRSDVLTRMNLALGPALKIYIRIQRLQTMSATKSFQS